MVIHQANELKDTKIKLSTETEKANVYKNYNDSLYITFREAMNHGIIEPQVEPIDNDIHYYAIMNEKLYEALVNANVYIEQDLAFYKSFDDLAGSQHYHVREEHLQYSTELLVEAIGATH